MKIFKFRKCSIKLFLFFAFFLLFNLNSSNAQAKGIDFFIDPGYDASSRAATTATLIETGQNAYYYIDDAFWDKLTPESKSALRTNITATDIEFDNVIYPNMHRLYGTEWTPGIDNDTKIYILFTDIIKDAGGYYNPYDEYYKNLVESDRNRKLQDLENEKRQDKDREKNKDKYAQKEKEIWLIFTNEKEILYLNANFADKTNIKSFLAHEFQHMINWYQKKKLYNADEEVWLNEALSEYTSTALGYNDIFIGSNLEARTRSFLRNPSDSLTEWKNLNQDYATVNLFMQFLADHYGKDILKMIVSSPKTGFSAINEALQKIDPYANYNNAFANWTITNYLNNQILFGGKYSYHNPNLSYNNLHVTPTSSYLVYGNIVAKSDEYAKDWSGKWYEFISSPVLSTPNQTLRINFRADDPGAVFQIPYVINKIDGTMIVKSLDLATEKNGVITIDNFGKEIKSVAIMPISEKKTAGFTENEQPTKFSYAASLAAQNQIVPIIKKITPAAASIKGGTLVTIIGENFNANSSIKFGNIKINEITFSDPDKIIVKAPPYPEARSVNIEITNPDMSSATAIRSFSYLPEIKDGSLIRAEGDYKVYVVSGAYRRWIQSSKIFNFYPHFGWINVIVVSSETRDYYKNSTLVRAFGDTKVYEISPDNAKHHLSMTPQKFADSGRDWNMVYVINNAERNFYRTGINITN